MPTTRVALVLGAVVATGVAANPSWGQGARASRYEDLVALFTQWREFQRPKLVDGLPDYTAGTMKAQQGELPVYQRRLAAIDTAGWPVPQQVDYHLVRAEMNGLDFDHRVLRPWAKNPAFYVSVFMSQSDQPAREGPHAWGSIEVWTHTFPLSADAAARLTAQVRLIPGLLKQATGNLVGDARDLWSMGIRSIRAQSDNLNSLAGRASGHPELMAQIQRARASTDQFRAWLEQQASSKTGPSGIGIENYDWYLRQVHLVPATWQDQVTLMRRELDRSALSSLNSGLYCTGRILRSMSMGGSAPKFMAKNSTA